MQYDPGLAGVRFMGKGYGMYKMKTVIYDEVAGETPIFPVDISLEMITGRA